MSILIFIIVIFVLVLVHELGHFIVAKLSGMRVDEFGIGFPPKLFGIRRGETEYTLNLFPIGGFVKIYGEDLNEDTSDVRSFSEKSKWVQSAVLIAGISMNIIFAWLLTATAFSYGVTMAVPEDKATETASLLVTSVIPGSPADDASLVPGVRIESVTNGSDTLTTLTPTAFSTFIESHPNEPVILAYTERSELKLVSLTPETGVIEESATRPAIGVSLSLVDTVSQPFGTSLIESLAYTATSLRDVTVGILGLIGDAIMLRADLSQVAGPVGIVDLVGEASTLGIASLLMFTAFISLNLAVINILPFPALDGGRLLFVAIEAVKGSPIRPRVAATFNTIGFSLLILLMLAVTWNDIVRLGT